MMLRRTLFLLSVCGVAAFAVLAARLYYLQIIRHDELEARAIAQQTPRMGFAVKALVAACGTAAMGRGLMAIYERDVDYSRLNDALANLASRAKGLASAVTARGVRYEQPQDGGAIA